jgi:transcriptional regulator with XRE-family HTH domain
MENIFKTRLKELRQENGIGQVELAQKLGVSKGVISLWENGLREPNMNSLILIAKFFEVTIDYLVGLE